MTTNPDHAWVAERAAEMQQVFALQPNRPTHLIRDLDGKYGTNVRPSAKPMGHWRHNKDYIGRFREFLHGFFIFSKNRAPLSWPVRLD